MLGMSLKLAGFGAADRFIQRNLSFRWEGPLLDRHLRVLFYYIATNSVDIGIHHVLLTTATLIMHRRRSLLVVTGKREGDLGCASKILLWLFSSAAMPIKTLLLYLILVDSSISWSFGTVFEEEVCRSIICLMIFAGDGDTATFHKIIHTLN